MKVLLILICSFGCLVTCENNVCSKMIDYDTKLTNKNCWFNSDPDLTVPEIIRKYGYPLETYEVTTQDGYILNLFRIPYDRCGVASLVRGKRQPVFLQHGIFASSAPWVINGNESIGFALADQGYDVWLGNSRGSQYGKGHVKYSLDDARYWNFSYHEMGIYDFPKSLDLIFKHTNRSDIIVIGNSMGTNIQLVYASELPMHARRRVKFMIYLAPTIFLRATRSPFVTKLAPIWPALQKFAKKHNINEILSRDQVSKQIVNSFCFRSVISMLLCESSIFSMFGFDYENFPPPIIPVVMGHYPAGSSVKTVLHLFQGVMENNFAKYDYNVYLNLKYYNHVKPPAYNLSAVEIPGYIIYGNNDWVGTPEGAKKLKKMLPSAIGIYKVRDNRYNHIDFFFAKNVKKQVIDHLLLILYMLKS